MQDLRDYFRAFAALPEAARQLGAEQAAARLAQDAQPLANPEAAAAFVEKTRARYHLTRQDAQTAFWILQEYHWSHYIRRRPIRGRIARFVAAFLRYKYPKAILETRDEVIVESPWGVACPLVRGFGGDLEQCRPLCEACFRHDVIIEPDQIALMKAAAPALRLVLHKYRESPDKHCEYALVSE
ncbi:MAG: hypothetical protein QHH80_10215 [Anaerolineae bacterium]|nr:hypothetical protein [Anaerolineae bacterium]